MVKTIKLDEKEVRVNSSMSWLFIYRNQFGHDILPDIMPLAEGLINILLNVSKHAEGNEISLETFKQIEPDEIEDAFITLSSMELTTFMNVFWALAKNADDEIPEPIEWFEKIETFPIDEVSKEVGSMLIQSLVSKKKFELLKKTLQKAK